MGKVRDLAEQLWNAERATIDHNPVVQRTEFNLCHNMYPFWRFLRSRYFNGTALAMPYDGFVSTLP